MTSWKKAWLIVLVLTIAAWYKPYFPGDIALTRFIQGIAPLPLDWAKWVSATAKFPWYLILLAIAVGASFLIAERRGALLALASFAGMWVLGKGLGPLVARPRPAPDLVYVADKLSGFSFPSIFALTYASTVGFLAVLLMKNTTGTLRAISVAACCAVLLIGLAARISLGAHWPSDVILSYLIGVLWADSLVHFA